jgi:hypothetical protein
MGRYRAADGETFFGFNANDGSQLGMWVYGGGTYIGRMAFAGISMKTWSHVVGVYDGGTTASSIKLYINGARADDTNSITGGFAAINNGAASMKIGRDSDTGYYFPGRIDDVRVYDRALSATEVKQLYNAGR